MGNRSFFKPIAINEIVIFMIIIIIIYNDDDAGDNGNNNFHFKQDNGLGISAVPPCTKICKLLVKI